jgi:hypothetical protein
MDPKLPSRLAPAAALLASLAPLSSAAVPAASTAARPAAALTADGPVIERLPQLRARLLQHDRLLQLGQPQATTPLLAQSWNNWKKWDNA